MHANYGSGIYLPLDADEFVIHEQGPDYFREELEALPINCQFTVPWRCLIASNESDDNDIDPISTFSFVEKKSLILGNNNKYFKTILKVDSQIEIEKIIISYGNHSVNDESNLLKIVECSNIYYLHIPVRSKGQISKKIILGWLANVIRHGEKKFGGHWYDLYYEMIKNNKLFIDNLNVIYKNKIYSNYDLSIQENIEEINTRILLNYELKYNDMRIGIYGLILKDLEELVINYYKKN